MTDITENASLLPHNTFGMDVRAAVWAEYDTADELIQLLHDPLVEGKKWLHVGQGSNLLFTADYDGAVLHSRIGGIDILADGEETVVIRAGSGVVWDDLCAWAVEHDLYGAENLSAIPGECGAAAVQNIGAYGAEIAQLMRVVEVLDVTSGRTLRIPAADCRYGYRSSIFKTDAARGKYIVTAIELALSRTEHYNIDYGNLREALRGVDPLTLAAVRQAIIATRRNKLPDPQQMGNAGSFFKNPVVERSLYERIKGIYPYMPSYDVDAQHVKIPAGWLIEQCGWKGRTLGNAGVYDKQCLVLVNRGGATPDEVIRLSEAIVRTVRERFDLIISPEVNFI